MIPDYPAIDYLRSNGHLFPPTQHGAPFDPISVASTIVRLSGLSLDTTFEDLSHWLGNIVAFQGVICPHGEAFVEVMQPSDVVELFKRKRAVRGCSPVLSISHYPRW